MSDQEIKSKLCYYDPENPNNILDAFDEEDRPKPRENCHCDSCFYGRDKLAVQLLKEMRERDNALAQIETISPKKNNPVAEFFSSSSTPETDAFAVKFKSVCGSKEWVPVDLSRRLERERDEAREENKKLREALEWIAKRYDDSKPMHSVAMDAYEMSCTARAALRKEVVS